MRADIVIHIQARQTNKEKKKWCSHMMVGWKVGAGQRFVVRCCFDAAGGMVRFSTLISFFLVLFVGGRNRTNVLRSRRGRCRQKKKGNELKRQTVCRGVTEGVVCGDWTVKDRIGVKRC